VLNRGVVATEGTGTSKRSVFTSPALMLAAQLAASFRDTRAFARILGGAGALEAPATHELTSGREAGTSVPTEAFYSMSAQATLAGLGLIGLGSARNSNKIALSAAPTARHATDAVPLPAQILAGKLVRFVSWVRRELPPDASDADAATMFEQAAQVFLFAGMGEGATLRAGVGKDADGKRVVEIAASLRAEHAAIPFQMAFTLPL
jgi:type VI secretion system protein ImpC